MHVLQRLSRCHLLDGKEQRRGKATLYTKGTFLYTCKCDCNCPLISIQQRVFICMMNEVLGDGCKPSHTTLEKYEVDKKISEQLQRSPVPIRAREPHAHPFRLCMKRGCNCFRAIAIAIAPEYSEAILVCFQKSHGHKKRIQYLGSFLAGHTSFEGSWSAAHSM